MGVVAKQSFYNVLVLSLLSPLGHLILLSFIQTQWGKNSTGLFDFIGAVQYTPAYFFLWNATYGD